MKPVDVTFDLRPSNPGKIDIVVTNNPAQTPVSVNIDVYIGVKGPLSTLKTKNLLGSPDITIMGSGASGTFSLDIPTTSAGAYLQGTYEFDITVSPNGAPPNGGSETEIRSYFFSPPGQNQTVPNVEIVVDCYAKVLFVTDKTDYTDIELTTKSLTVRHPNIPGITTPADTSTAESELQIPLTHENVTYTIELEADLDKETVIGNYTFHTLEAIQWVDDQKIVCDFDACKILPCVDDTITKLQQKACSRGGFLNLNATDQALLLALNTYLTLYDYYIRCKEVDKAQEYYDKIITALGGCDCPPDDNIARPIEPSPGIQYLAGQQGATGNDGLSAYEIWLGEGNVGTEQDFLDSLIGGAPTAWTDVPVGDYQTDFAQAGGDPLRYRTSVNHFEVTGQFLYSGILTGKQSFSFLSNNFSGVSWPELLYFVVIDAADHKVVGRITPASPFWTFATNADFQGSSNALQFTAVMPIG